MRVNTPYRGFSPNGLTSPYRANGGFVSKEITKEEARQMFLDHCMDIANYWANNDRAATTREKIDGFAFSLMNIFDGTSGGFPAAIDLVLRPHKDDKQFCIDNGDDWIVDGQVINDNCNLHEMIFNQQPAGQE